MDALTDRIGVWQIESYFYSAFQPTPAGREIVSHEFKKLKQRFFAPPRMEKGGRESVLNDPVNIVFVYIGTTTYLLHFQGFLTLFQARFQRPLLFNAHHVCVYVCVRVADVVLNSQNCSLGELFLAYDQSGSGYMSHDDFITFMKSLPIRLQSEQIKGIIQKVSHEHGQSHMIATPYLLTMHDRGIWNAPPHLSCDPPALLPMGPSSTGGCLGRRLRDAGGAHDGAEAGTRGPGRARVPVEVLRGPRPVRHVLPQYPHRREGASAHRPSIHS